MRGNGRVFRRGKTWWIAYCVDRKERRESSKNCRRSTAVDLLRTRLGEVAAGKLSPAGRATFNSVADNYIAAMKIAGRKSVRTSEVHLRHPRSVFGTTPASSISSASLRSYQEQRLRLRAARATVDREVELILSALRLAVRDGLLSSVPYVAHLLARNANARSGFLTGEEFSRIPVEAVAVQLGGGVQWMSLRRAMLRARYATTDATETRPVSRNFFAFAPEPRKSSALLRTARRPQTAPRKPP